MKKQKRYKSWAVWLSFLGLVGLILNQTGVLAKLGMDTVTWEMFVNAIGGVLVGFGILNNPTERSEF